MKKRWQYVVLTRSGRIPLALESFEDGQRILAIGGVTKRFPTYEAARSAIRRTSRYAVQHGLGCCTTDHFRIMRRMFVENPPATSRGKMVLQTLRWSILTLLFPLILDIHL